MHIHTSDLLELDSFPRKQLKDLGESSWWFGGGKKAYRLFVWPCPGESGTHRSLPAGGHLAEEQLRAG